VTKCLRGHNKILHTAYVTLWRKLRIAILLFILATVAQAAWIARARTTEWNNTVRVVIYPVNGDGSGVAAGYIGGLRKAGFEPIEAFLGSEAAAYGVALRKPIEIDLALPVASQPPSPPFGGNKLEVVLWSLQLRYWAWRHDDYRGPKPDVRIFVSYFDPAAHPRLAHSTGLQKGLIGVVNAFARADMDGSNNVVIAHELMHTFGATDKYATGSNRPLFPEGYADPHAVPLYPQSRAEIMAGRIPVSETQAEMPVGMDEVAIGTVTAQEINWVK
jgi:hypothetical protein